MRYLYSKLKRSIKLKNTFQKLIFSYIVIISIILFITSIILYNGYKNQIIDQSGIVSEKLLNQSDYYTEYTLRWATSYLYQLYLDKDIYNLVFNSNINDEQLQLGANRIKQAVSIHPSIQSIYVYNSRNKMIYPSDGKPSAYSDFYDRDVERLFRENGDSLSTQFIPRKIRISLNGNEYLKNVLTLMLMNVKDTGTNLPYGAIILNLDAANVQNYYRNITENDYSILAVDNRGRIVLNSDTSLFLEDLSGKDYIKKILDGKESSGGFFALINEKPSIITYKTSSRLGLKFISTIPYDTLAGTINNMLKLLIYTSILLFLLCAAIAFFSSKKIYSPIDKSVKAIKSYVNTYDGSGIDIGENEANDSEMEYLTKIIDVIIHQPRSLKKMNGSDVKFIKKQLLTGLLFNTPFEIDNFKNKLLEIGANIEFKNILVILFRFDSYKGIINGQNREKFDKLKSGVCIETLRIFADNYRSELVVTEEDEFCIITSIEHEINDGITDNLSRIISDVLFRIDNEFSIPLSASIGDYVHEIEDTSRSYKAAREYMSYSFKYGYKSILFKQKIMSDIVTNFKYDEAVEEVLFKELRAGNAVKVENELDKIFEIIKKLSYYDMLLAVSRLIDSSEKVIASMLQMSKSSMNLHVGGFTSDPKSYHDLSEVKDSIFVLYKKTINQLKEKKRNRRNEIIDRVINYIKENYAQELLSPEAIAETMNLSGNYLRMMFKELEGKSISNYINEVRFSKAKHLLESTDLTVAEISARVGIANCNYFYTAFKKYYGVSPNYYRNNIKIVSL